MYLDDVSIAIAITVFMFLGAVGNECARWFVTRKNKKTEFTDTLKKVRK